MHSLPFFSALPSESTLLTIPQSIAKMEALEQTELISMSSAAIHRKINCVLEILEKMKVGVSPDTTLASSADFYKKLLNRLSFFMVCKDNDGNTLSGQPALEFEWARVATEISKSECNLTLSDMEPFKVNKWMLSEERVAELGQWVNIVLKHMAAHEPESKQLSMSDAAKHSRSSHSGSCSKSAARKTATGDQPNKGIKGKAAVLKYF